MVLSQNQKNKHQHANESEMKFCLFEITGDKEFFKRSPISALAAAGVRE
jgi:hypothetical protein